MDLKFIIFLAI